MVGWRTALVEDGFSGGMEDSFSGGMEDSFSGGQL